MTTRREDNPRVLVTGGSGFIGGHLVGTLGRQPGYQVCNLDTSAPWIESQKTMWHGTDLLDRDGLQRAITKWQPTQVIHLAADVDASPSRDLSDYAANTEGTRNLIDAVADTESVEHLIMTSTQFVCRPGYVPRDDTDFDPHTAYGESKVACEQMTRDADLDGTRWTIIRPTTIWGPGDDGYRRAFHSLMRRGWYRHPDVGPCMRSYGFVGNVVWQIRQLLAIGPDAHGKVVYLGDPEGDVRDFVDAFSMAWHDRPARTLPRRLAASAAAIGSVTKRIGLAAPVDRGRYESLSTDYPVPIEPTFALLGSAPASLSDGANHTVRWMRGTGPALWID